MGDKRFVNELDTVLKIQNSLLLMCKVQERYGSRDYRAISLKSKESEYLKLAAEGCNSNHATVVRTMSPFAQIGTLCGVM